jgi:hypothetical protein
MKCFNVLFKFKTKSAIVIAGVLGFGLAAFSQPILVPSTNPNPYIGGPGASPFQANPEIAMGPNSPNSPPLLPSGRLSQLDEKKLTRPCPPSVAGREMDRDSSDLGFQNECEIGMSLALRPFTPNEERAGAAGISGRQFKESEAELERKTD